MSINAYDTGRLERVIEGIVASNAEPVQFLARTFFSTVSRSDSEEIFFDVVDGKPRITPFVSPLVEGKVVAGRGFSTKSFKPAYLKEKRVIRPQQGLKRRPGEPIMGSMSPESRIQAAVSENLADMLKMLNRRFEVMATEVLLTGKQVVAGEGYATQEVDFQRNAGHTIALTGASRWGQSGVSPLANLREWAITVRTSSGLAPRTVVMEDTAFEAFLKDPEVKALFDVRRGTSISLSLDPVVADEKAVFRGNIGSFDIWTYNDVYVDDDGADQTLLPAGTVLLVAREGLEGVRHHGAILDEAAGIRPVEYFIKSWSQEDPPVRYMLLQSSALVVPYRANASFCATVL
ncbi:MAG: major capsid protein [Chloroflexi bacterium]|nr:major capsid protein [Chloroflexota bacterium]